MAPRGHYVLLRDLPYGTTSEVVLQGIDADLAALRLRSKGIVLPRTFHPHDLDHLSLLQASHDAARIVASIIRHLTAGRTVSVELRPIG